MITAPEAEPQRLAQPDTVAPIQTEKDGNRRWPVSAATTIVVTVAALLSVAAYLHFYPGGATIAYDDARSHMLIARRVLMADTPGAGQLGAV